MSESDDLNTVSRAHSLSFGEFITAKYLESNMIESRSYQETLISESVSESSLVALPTGTGKTIVSAVITAIRLEVHSGSRSVFLAPTKPLVEQQAEFYKTVFDIPEAEITVFTGDTRPDKREELWTRPQSIVFATPQVIQNDLISGRISFDDVSHITFDECHRATGEYAYTFIAEKYWQEAENPLVTGLSASPGSSKEDILRVAKNLGVTNISVVTEDDPELQPYVHETSIEPVWIDLDEEISESLSAFQSVYSELLTELKDIGVLSSRNVRSVGYIELQKALQKARNMESDDKYRALSLTAEAMKVDSLLEVLETQGPKATIRKMRSYKQDATESDSSKALKRLVQRSEFKQILKQLSDYDSLYPKKSELFISLHDPLQSGGQAIVFTQYRSTALDLVDTLNESPAISAHEFIGQNNTDGHGMTQSEQQTVINNFRNGDYTVLVATSVAEEGLDIPQVDIVIFYEPVPSGIRSIQRRGRTGRSAAGTVRVLIASGTRDEGYWYASKSKEDAMSNSLTYLGNIQTELQDELQTNQTTLTTPHTTTQETLTEEHVSENLPENTPDTETPAPSPDTSTEDIHIIVDTRELQSKIPRTLSKTADIRIEQEQLDVGDFILSDRVAVERKSVSDFADTLVGDRSIFEQLGNLATAYDRPVLLIEGTQEELFNARNIHENAIRGTLASIAVDYGISILWTRSETETATLLTHIATREQTETNSAKPSAHGTKTTNTQTEQQEYIISSFEGIGPVTAQALLETHNSIYNIMNATQSELTNTPGIGEKTAAFIHDMIHEEYNPE